MSRADISQALETRLNALPNKPPIAWENLNFTPATGVGYLTAFTLFTAPEDIGLADSTVVQRGYMQVGVHWPTNTGGGAAKAKAEEIANWFPRRLTLENDGTVVVIDRTPEITGGSVEDGRYVVRVRIRFYSQMPA